MLLHRVVKDEGFVACFKVWLAALGLSPTRKDAGLYEYSANRLRDAPNAALNDCSHPLTRM